jgi:hypothetical protein
MPRPSVSPVEIVQSRIIVLRQQRVILAADLARLYGVPTKRLNEQVRRNARKFPSDVRLPAHPRESRLGPAFKVARCDRETRPERADAGLQSSRELTAHSRCRAFNPA